MITADARATVAFYADALGLRRVKKTVNFDAPDAYHLYFGDESGAPGSILTWFEFPGAARGRAGLGDVHLLQLAVAARRPRLLGRPGGTPGAIRRSGPTSGRCASPTTTGSRSSSSSSRWATPRCAPRIRTSPPSTRSSAWRAPATTLPPLGARGHALHRRPRLHALTARASTSCRVGCRRFRWGLDVARGHGAQGAGTVHHIAWASRDEDHLGWQERVRRPGGSSPTSATATTSSRSTSASPAACSSRSRRCHRASPSTRTPSTRRGAPAPRGCTSTAAAARGDPRAGEATRGWRHERARPARAARRTGDPEGCSSSTTGAAPTSTTCWARRRARPGAAPARGHAPRAADLPGWPGNHWYVVRVWAIPTMTRSTPPSPSSPPCTTSCGSGRGSGRSGPCSAGSRWGRS